MILILYADYQIQQLSHLLIVLAEKMNQVSVRITTQEITPCREVKRFRATVGTVGIMGTSYSCVLHSGSHYL